MDKGNQRTPLVAVASKGGSQQVSLFFLLSGEGGKGSVRADLHALIFVHELAWYKEAISLYMYLASPQPRPVYKGSCTLNQAQKKK